MRTLHLSSTVPAMTLLLLVGACGPAAEQRVEQAGAEAARELSDAAITAQVETTLAASATTDALDIDVDTEAGVVTLSGTVGSELESRTATELAEGVNGVRRVVDELTIGAEEAGDGTTRYTGPAAEEIRAASGEAKDGLITAAVKGKLLLDPELEGLAIDVDTSGGVVTLSGLVPSATLRQQAVRIAATTQGVAEVVDNLTTGS